MLINMLAYLRQSLIKMHGQVVTFNQVHFQVFSGVILPPVISQIIVGRMNGIKVFGLVGKARQAKRQLDAGVDAVIAQGYDAAGHTGAVGTFSIVPEIAAMAGDTPIIAAGGVTTGRHLAAALCLGASGVW
ncbi:MAG: nitronate monooxygenase, partial [Algicola sp.]|nr:nitronate monooxygenase [Algicola sp.]